MNQINNEWEWEWEWANKTHPMYEGSEEVEKELHDQNVEYFQYEIAEF